MRPDPRPHDAAPDRRRAQLRRCPRRMGALGPLVEQLGIGNKGVGWKPVEEVAELAVRHGTVRGGVADGRPVMSRADALLPDHAGTLGHDQRATRARRLPSPGTPVRHTPGRPRRGARRQPDRLRGCSDPAAQGDGLARAGRGWRAASAGTRRSPSTSSATCPSGRSPAASTSTSTIRGCLSTARGCRSTARRSTSPATRVQRSWMTGSPRSPCVT